MTIHFACDCGRPFSVRNARAGKIATCPDCGTELLVPHKSRISKREAHAEHLRKRGFRDTDQDLAAAVSFDEILEASQSDADASAPETPRELELTDSDPDLEYDDEDDLAGLSPEEWAASGFPEEPRAPATDSRAQSWEVRSGLTSADRHRRRRTTGRTQPPAKRTPPPAKRTSKVTGRHKGGAPKAGRKWWKVRLAVLIVTLVVLIVANPYSLTNLRRMLFGQERVDAAVAHNDRGVRFDNDNKLDEAIVEFEAAVRLAPDLFEAHYNLGNSLDAAGRTQDSHAAYRSAYDLNPYHAGASFGLSAALFKMRRFDEAEQQLRTTLELDALHPDAHLYLSYALYQQRRYEEALEELHTAGDLGAHFHGTFAANLQAAVAASKNE